jgi:hypothetical protein
VYRVGTLGEKRTWSAVIASPLLLAELELVLRRPKFAAYVDEQTVREFVERIRRHATVVDDPVEQPRSRETARTTASSPSHAASTSTRSSAAIATSSMPRSQIRQCGLRARRRTSCCVVSETQ